MKISFLLLVAVFLCSVTSSVISLEELNPLVSDSVSSILANVPNMFVWQYWDVNDYADYATASGGEANGIMDGNNDMYDYGNKLSTNLGGGFLSYTGGVIRNGPSNIVGPNGRYFTMELPGLFVLAADMDNVDWFMISGNLGSDGATANRQWFLPTAHVDGAAHYASVKQNIENSTSSSRDPSVNHIIIVVDPSTTPNATINLAPNDDDDHKVTLEGATRVYYLLYADWPGTLMAESVAQGVFDTFLSLLSSGSASITGDPRVVGFRGQQFDIHGAPGVYSLLRSSRFAVNVLIDHIPELAPEDNFVITHVGVIAVVNDTVKKMIVDGEGFSSQFDFFQMGYKPEWSSSGVVIDLGSARVSVAPKVVQSTIVRHGETWVYPAAKFLDVSVKSLDKAGERSWSGLLGATAYEWDIDHNTLVAEPWMHLNSSSLADFAVEHLLSV